jgi:glycosyltransferase involved in cell wall biosynthesis
MWSQIWIPEECQMTRIEKQKISVVVCVRNEERRIEGCLETILANDPYEIIVVDGNSSDRTVAIARKYTDKVIVTKNSNLSRDRQLGIDEAACDFIAMIDADHRLYKGDLLSLLTDLHKYNLDIVQSQLISFDNPSFWNAAEEQAWELTHNIPGPKNMIGVAPAIFKKSVFSKVRFDDRITKLIDDTDFMYRLSKFKEIKIGIGETKIRQLHFGNFKDYYKKFFWYGRGDGQFVVKNPSRLSSMLFHLSIRYPINYSIKAAKKRKLKVIPFFVMQGTVRNLGLISEVVKLKFSKKKEPVDATV